MVKKDKQPEPLFSDELNDEIKELMGPPPEEAEAGDESHDYGQPDESDAPNIEPVGPPPVVKEGRIYVRDAREEKPKPDTVNELEPDVSAKASSKKPIPVTEPDDSGETGKPTTELAREDTGVSAVAEEINQQILAQQAGEQKSASSLKIVDNSVGPVQAEQSIEEDEVLDKAVTDIIAKESDELLAVEDAVRGSVAPNVTPKKPKTNLFVAWWRNKKLRYSTIGLVLAILLAAAIVPYSRYLILNTVGVRAGLSVKIIDTKYGLPIKNVEVKAGGQSGVTDIDGYVKLSKVKLGKTELVISKRSFAPKTQTIVVGWGSNPFNDPIQIDATGSAYNFVVTDWLSNKPIAKAEVSDGDSKVLTDDQGRVSMLLQSDDKDIKFYVKADGYRNESITIDSSYKDQKNIKLVLSNPDIFVSKRSGKYDIYKKDLDGANEVVLMGGSGSEQDNIGLLSNQAGSKVAVVSTRDGKRDKDGFMLSNLYLIDVATKTVDKVPDTEAAQIQLIDWADDKLVFVKIESGASAASLTRHKIMVYDAKTEKVATISSANYFNDVEVVKNQIYYAQNSTGGTAQLVRINPDSSAKTILLDQEVWRIARLKNSRIQALAADKKWYDQQIGEAKMVVMANQPNDSQSRPYFDSPSAEKTAFIDERDGKGVLIIEDTKTADNKVLVSRGGLGYPIRWLSDKHLLVRVSNSQETADYVINLDGGEFTKVSDVTTTAITSQWYYYR